MAVCGCMWLCVAVRGCAWMWVDVCGCGWLCVAVRGCVWRCMAERVSLLYSLSVGMAQRRTITSISHTKNRTQSSLALLPGPLNSPNE